MTVAVDDTLWSAVGDPTRRRMLDLLVNDGIGTATALSHRLPVSRQAISKHLLVLDRAGLVRGSVAGKERRYHVDEEQLGRAIAQLTAVTAEWDKRLRRIRKLAEELQRARGDGGD
jgi:ArsR family transcriptional regulator, cadmium/lead-responsive transcriptional repressor